MVFWRYYEIGDGISHPYNHLKIQPMAEIIKDFSETRTNELANSNPKKAKRSSREFCHRIYCMEPGCSSSFEIEKRGEYEAHMLSGNHSGIAHVTSMDSVKGMFVDKMKSLSEARSSTSSFSTVETVSSPPNDIMKIKVPI